MTKLKFFFLFLVAFSFQATFAHSTYHEPRTYPTSSYKSSLPVFSSRTDYYSTLYDLDRHVLRGGWHFWDPYQYIETTGEGAVLTGLDIELQKLILAQAGFNVEFPEVSLRQHQEDLETGERDVAMGAFYSPRRAKYNYLTVPYRFEENSFFVLRKNLLKNNYTDVKGFLEHIKQNNLVIGVTDGYLYASSEINNFIENPDNARHILKLPNDLRKVNYLISKKIDGFLSDRIAGATVIWRQKLGQFVAEKRIKGVKAPVYMLLSRETVSPEDYTKINNVVKEIKENNEYNKIVSWYLYPVILLETTSSFWFNMIEMIGILAFAISGLVVGYRHNATLLGTLILALLPSFGGGVLRDILVGRFPVWFLQADYYIIIVSIVVFLGFFMIRYSPLIKRYTQKSSLINKYYLIISKHSDPLMDKALLLTDAIGLATFTVTGVLVCMIGKTSPLWLWGPAFAFLSGAGGGMIRDFVVKGDKNEKIAAINGQIYGEIAVFWGAFLSLYLFFHAHDVNPSHIKFSVIFTIIMCFLTRVVIYIFDIPNLKIVSSSLHKKGAS